jgi:hypothetical protein
VTLETVPPVAASVVGSRFRINLLLATGGAVSADTSGIAGVIELGLMAGDAFEAQNGLNESIELSLTTGEAFGGITGLHESIELVLDAGAAASTSGISGVLDLALLTGDAFVDLAGIDEAIDLAVAGGAAEEVVPSGPIDPDFASVSLLLHMDGSNGSTTFTDVSSNALTVTAFGGVQISTAQSRFGGSSALFDGVNDYLSVAVPGGLGSGNFTLEMWLYPTSSNTSIFVNRSDGTAADGIDTLSGLRVGTAGFFIINNSFQLTQNEWTHVAFVRSAGTFVRYINGVLDGSRAGTTNNFNGSSFRIGGNPWPSGNTGYFAGHIDDLRVTVGVARYTANFTPPTAPFPDS